MLYENTVVILGYKLGDTNLKAILSEYNTYANDNHNTLNIFFVTRNSVQQELKDYYCRSFGIQVIEGMEIKDFFQQVNNRISDAEKAKEFTDDIHYRLSNDKGNDWGTICNEEHLKIENSFYEIYNAAFSSSRANNAKIEEIITTIFTMKRNLTRQDGAWEQYAHLAKWLIYLLSKMKLQKNMPFTKNILEVVEFSFLNMRKGYTFDPCCQFRTVKLGRF